MRKNETPLRIAVAGLGRIGWGQHARSLVKHPDFHLAAVADPEAERRAEAERELKCAAFADFTRMLDETDLDAVAVATPTHLHHPMAMEALRRKLHVILEKPMALDAREAAAVIRAARSRQRVLTVYQPHRLSARFQHLRHVIATGKIGRIVHVQDAMFDYSRRNDWQALRKFGGGMLANYGAHCLDVTLALIGYDIRRIFCHRQIVASLGDAEDAVKIVLETKGGVLGDVDINQASTIVPYRMLVWGTCGAIRVDRDAQYHDVLYLRYFDPKKLPAVRLDRRLASAGRKYPPRNPAYIEETIPVDPKFAVNLYSDFARAIRAGAAPFCKPEETLCVMRLMDRCRKMFPDIADLRK